MLRGWVDAFDYFDLPCELALVRDLDSTRRFDFDADSIFCAIDSDQVIRFIPALIVTEEEMETATSILKKALEEVALEG